MNKILITKICTNLNLRSNIFLLGCTKEKLLVALYLWKSIEEMNDGEKRFDIYGLKRVIKIGWKEKVGKETGIYIRKNRANNIASSAFSFHRLFTLFDN